MPATESPADRRTVSGGRRIRVVDRLYASAAPAGLWARLSAERDVIDREHDHRAEDRHEEAARRRVRGVEPDRAADEPTEERAGDAEERRDHEAARIAPRGQ